MLDVKCFFASLFVSLLLVGWRPTDAAAQGVIQTRVTYYDAAHAQRRAVFGVVLRGSRPDTVPHGSYRRYWRTGSLAEVGHFTQGQADSVWTRYYPAAPGQAPAVARRLAMRAGQPDGPFTVWHPNGQLAQRGTFRQGQLLDSVVSRTASGQPQLLAHFASPATDSARPTGSFRQWRSGVTAAPLTFGWRQQTEYSYNNPYPASDSGRYWTGQLTKGRLTGVVSEKDADGQLRVRLVYNEAGQLQLVTQYYPAAWLRHEAQQYTYYIDSLPHSQPFWQWQAVGSRPYLLLQRWDVEGRWERYLVAAVGASRHPGPPRCGVAAQPAPVEVGALMRLAGYGAAWSLPFLHQSGWPTVPGLPAKPALAAARSPLHPAALRYVHRPSPWLVGKTDTLTGAYRLVPQRVTTSPGGTRTVEALGITRRYRADGSLLSEERVTRFGNVTTQEYYPNGQLKSKAHRYYTSERASYHEWNERGQLMRATRVNRRGFRYARHRDRTGHMPLFKSRISGPPRFR